MKSITKKISQPEGNYYNKYETGNKIHQLLMSGFFSGIDALLDEIPFRSFYEAGCGEGYVSAHVHGRYTVSYAAGSDISEDKAAEAQIRNPGSTITVASVYELPEENRSYDLVIASEVMEHLEDPKSAMNELCRISDKYVLITVPREPIWRILNFLRGKYMKDFGNTPGHIQHWSYGGVRRFLASQEGFHVCASRSPFPWSAVLLERDDHNGKV